MKLSEHFTLEEFITSQTAVRYGIDNKPPEEVIKNLKWLCTVLEEVRTLCGNMPIIVTSGYRCPELNTIVRGSLNSQHTQGLAVDFYIPELTLKGIICKIKSSAIMYDQLILEFNSWIHLGITPEPRRQTLIVDQNGTRQFVI